MPEELPKILIVDASIMFSFFRKQPTRRKMVEEMYEFGCKLISPEFAFKELSDKRERIKKFGEVNELAFAFLFSLLDRKIESFSNDIYKGFLPEANKISPHGKQTEDDPYFALALALNCAIWSDENAFKEQSRVKVFNTKELFELINKSKDKSAYGDIGK